MGNVQKSFTTKGLGVILSNVTAAVIEAEKLAKSSKEIQTLDILRPGLRQDIYIGKVLVVPPAVMDNQEKVPLPLFKGAILNLFDAEAASAYDSHRLAESEFDQLTNKDFVEFKDKVFKDEDGKYTCIVMFLPAWANPRDFIGFKFEKEISKLEQLIRHLVFSAYFNPSLSALFETLEESDSKLDVKNLQHDHFGPVFDLMSASNTYPILGRVEKKASTKKAYLRFTASELDAIKNELLSPEEQAVIDELEDVVEKKVHVAKKAGMGVCESCAAPTVDGNLLCEDCQSKEKLSLEDTEDTSIEALAQSVADEAKEKINDNYLSSSDDTMSLIEDVDADIYGESTDEAIYEIMALKSVPYDIAEAVAERVKELIQGGIGTGLHDESGEDIDIGTMADDSLPPDLQAELDELDKQSGWEKPVISSKSKHSFIDFFTKCKGCGALTSVPPGTIDEDLVFCPQCDGVSKDLDEHPFEEEAGILETCPGCETTEAFVDGKLGGKTVDKDDNHLARKIYDKCFKGKKSATNEQIQKIMGEELGYSEFKKAMFHLWRFGFILPDMDKEGKLGKVNTWLTFDAEKGTPKNTYNGNNWPWPDHEKTSNRKTAFQEYYVHPENGKFFVVHIHNGTIAEFDTKEAAEAEEYRLNKLPKATRMGGLKQADGTISHIDRDYVEPKRKVEPQSKRESEKIKETKYNEPDRKTELPSKKLDSSEPDHSTKLPTQRTGGLKNFRRLLRPGQVKNSGRRLKVMDRDGVFIVKSFRNEYLALTDEGGEWAWDLADATRFNSSYEAEDAAMEYGGEAIPDPSFEQNSEEQEMDKGFLRGIGIQGKKTAAGFSYVEQAFGDGMNKIDPSNDSTDDMLLNESSKIKAPDLKINPKKSHYRKLAFDWMAPDQVLRDFYPEMRNQLQTNMHDKDDYHPVKPDEQEREGSANDDITLNDHESKEKHTLTSPGLISTEEGGASGAPLRSGERNIRGPFFTDQFYKIHADIPASSLVIKSSLNKLAAETDKVALVETYLSSLAAEIASSLLAAFVVEPKLNFIDIPTEGKIDLKSSPSVFLNPMLSRDVQDPIVSQLEMFFNGLNDNELTDAINAAWAQSAVWKEDNANGFLYEVFVRIESVDIDNMTISYKFVAKKKEK